MLDKILLVDTTTYTLKEFCENYFAGCKFEEDLLTYEGKTYELCRCEEVGIQIKHVRIYKIVEYVA